MSRPPTSSSITYGQYDALTRMYFWVFALRVLAEVSPGVKYSDNWHVHVIIAALERVRLGLDRHLAVALPPRSLKSIIVSIAFPAWLLGIDPTVKIICASYGQDLSDKLAYGCRQVLQSAWYRRLFPQTRLARGRQALQNYETTAGGGRFSTSVDGVITGFGAHYIILDDPMKPGQSLSDAERAKINHWIRHTLLSRFDDKIAGHLLVVMQRLHEDDVIGNLLSAFGDPAHDE